MICENMRNKHKQQRKQQQQTVVVVVDFHDLLCFAHTQLQQFQLWSVIQFIAANKNKANARTHTHTHAQRELNVA